MEFLKLEKQTTWLLSIGGVGLAVLYLVNAQYGIEFQKIVGLVLGALVSLFLIIESNYKLTMKKGVKDVRGVIGGVGMLVGVVLALTFLADLFTLQGSMAWLLPFQAVIGWLALIMFVLLALID